MNDPFALVTSQLLECRRQDLLRDAEKRRLLRQAARTSPRLAQRLAAIVGGMLIQAGQRLQDTYALTATHQARPASVLPGQS